MDSYPYQRNQMPYVPYYYPTGQTARPHLTVDPARFMVPSESWPFGGNQGYAYPDFHGCCYHNYHPSYCTFRPPYPHIAPHHCHPTYPANPGFYPAHYVPPPYFPTEQPCYEYEKNLPTEHHCCGCPNHPCKQNLKKNVKIEEHDEDTDRKNSEAMVPINGNSHPYPVVWLPYGDAKREHAKRPPFKLAHKDREETNNEAKHPRDLESFQQPIVWNNGWSPLDMKGSPGMKKGEDLQTNQRKQDDDNMHFPIPIFWMPYQPENAGRKLEREGSDSGPDNLDQENSHIESMPKGYLHKDEDKTFSSMNNEVSTGNDEKMVNKEFSPKIIPVKQLEETDLKPASGKSEGQSTSSSTKHNNNNGDKKLDENGDKKSSSPKKPPKLAPICLRVDPLPRKKGNNGGSRSPSPPGSKGKSHDMPKDKPPVPLNGEITKSKGPVTCRLPDGASEVEESNHKTKTVVVTEGTTEGDGLKDLNVGCTVSTSRSDNQMGNGEAEAPSEPGKKCSGEGIQCDSAGQTKKRIKKQLTEDEAATVIQSVYRGYEVRKWEPLKKIKQIANVGEQVAEIRSRIQALENSSDKPFDNKQKNLIAETIMSLLLKLDSIQGLHPAVRDIRKYVARELVNLQEKLDSITDRSPPQAVTEQPLSAEFMEDTMRVDGNVKAVQEDRDTNIKEQCNDQPLSVENSQIMVVNGHGDNENIDEVLADSQPTSKDLEMKEILEHNAQESSLELSREDHNAQECSLSKEMNHNVKDIAEINTEVPKEKITSCVEQQVAQMKPCMLDEESATQESIVCEHTVTGNTGMPQDEASRGLEAESVEKEVVDMAEQLTPFNSVPDNNTKCKEKEMQDVESPQIGTHVEAQVENVGVLNEVAEFPELEDKGVVEAEENKQIIGSVKDELEVIMQREGTTKPIKAEELVEVPQEKSQRAVDNDLLNEVAEFPELNDNGGLEENKEMFGGIEGELSSTLQPDAIKESDGATKLVEVPEKTECAVCKDLLIEAAEFNDKDGLEENKETVKGDAIKETDGATKLKDAVEVPLEKSIDPKPREVEEENVALNSARDENGSTAEVEEDILVPASPTACNQICIQSEDGGRKLIEENEKLRKMMEELIESGKEQLTTISALSARINQLEKRLSRRKKLKMRQHKAEKRDAIQVM